VNINAATVQLTESDRGIPQTIDITDPSSGITTNTLTFLDAWCQYVYNVNLLGWIPRGVWTRVAIAVLASSNADMTSILSSIDNGIAGVPLSSTSSGGDFMSNLAVPSDHFFDIRLGAPAPSTIADAASLVIGSAALIFAGEDEKAIAKLQGEVDNLQDAGVVTAQQITQLNNITFTLENWAAGENNVVLGMGQELSNLTFDVFNMNQALGNLAYNVSSIGASVASIGQYVNQSNIAIYNALQNLQSQEGNVSKAIFVELVGDINQIQLSLLQYVYQQQIVVSYILADLQQVYNDIDMLRLLTQAYSNATQSFVDPLPSTVFSRDTGQAPATPAEIALMQTPSGALNMGNVYFQFTRNITSPTQQYVATQIKLTYKTDPIFALNMSSTFINLDSLFIYLGPIQLNNGQNCYAGVTSNNVTWSCHNVINIEVWT